MNYDRICRADFIYSRMEQLKKGTEDKKEVLCDLTLRGCQYGRKEEKAWELRICWHLRARM